MNSLELYKSVGNEMVTSLFGNSNTVVFRLTEKYTQWLH